MLALRRYFQNPFDNDEISIDELVNYVTEHLHRMIASNPGGAFNSFITATTTALAALDATLTTETGKLGTQKACTQAKKTFRKTLAREIAKIEADFVSSFGRDSVEVTEAFPGGRYIFSRCDDSLLENKLGALHTAVTAFSASLKPGNVALAGSLLSIWTALYAAAGEGRGGRSTSAGARRTAKKALARQCFKNLLGLAAHFSDENEETALAKAGFYCPQHLLEDRAHGGGGEGAGGEPGS